MLSEKRIKQLVKKNKELLDALEEFDRTGQLGRIISKERVNFTIDMEIMRKFRSYCEKNKLKMSPFLEILLEEKLAKV